MAGQVRMEEFLAKAVTVDGRKSDADKRLDEVELSQVPHKHSASVTICVNKMVPAGRSRHLQVELKFKFFGVKLNV